MTYKGTSASFNSSQPWNIPHREAARKISSHPSSLECPPLFSVSTSLGSSPTTSFSASPLDFRTRAARDRGNSFGTDVSSASSAQGFPPAAEFCPRHGSVQSGLHGFPELPRALPVQQHWPNNASHSLITAQVRDEQPLEQTPAWEDQLLRATTNANDESAVEQEQLVANAQGGDIEPFPPFDGMEITTDELGLNLDEFNSGLGGYSIAQPSGLPQYATSASADFAALPSNLEDDRSGLSNNNNTQEAVVNFPAAWASNPGMPSSRHSVSSVTVTAQDVESTRQPQSSSDSGKGKAAPHCRKGRVPGSKLSDAKKTKIAHMRKLGACQYCKDGRRGCDTGLPCRPCLLHFGPLVLDRGNHCRSCPVETLTNLILADSVKWHPRAQDPCGLLGRNCSISDWTMTIPIILGCGPPMPVSVRVVQTRDPSRCIHHHATYTSHLSPNPTFTCDFVLQAVLDQAEVDRLETLLDAHLTTIVDHHINEFPPYYARFQVLDKIYALYQHYRSDDNGEYAALLQLSLKMLVLVHINVTLRLDDPAVQRILRTFGKGYEPFRHNVTPCLIRTEFGRAMPRLARIMLREILKGLFKISFTRRCEQHPVVVAVFAVVMMILEGIMHHAARLPYHFASTPSPPYDNVVFDPAFPAHDAASTSLAKGEESAAILLSLYRNCFENCHALLLRCTEQKQLVMLQKKGAGDVPVKIVHAMSAAVQKAGAYLESRSSVSMEEALKDVSSIFDRLVGRLFLLKADKD